MGRGKRKRKTRDRHGGRRAEKRITGGVSQEKGDGERRPTEETHAGDGSDEGRGPSIYLVACYWDWSRSRKPFSVYEMTDAAACVGSGAWRLTPAGSRRAWIVGVGGDHGDTVIFDTETKVSIQGPRLKSSAKWCPVLTIVGDRVYAMSKFPPWFEVLDLSKSRVVTVGGGCSYLEDCCWSEVPIPACLPWKLHPIEYTILPFVKLWSYAVVGRYIVVSFNQPWGTHALDTDSHEWHKVDDERLPFIGCAVRHGCIFLAMSKENGPLNAYSICVAPSGRDDALNLWIDTHSFDFNRDYNEWFPRKLLVKLKTYETEDTSILETSKEALLAVKQTIAVSSRREDFKISSSSHGFSPFGFTLLSI
uniref:Uncharacterized protein n=1 Tax=Setaria viridis TaxID=4556 RepID=A0A4U6UD53_SETVI|nr:hypothetical protein SEVIR_5G133200v2 [Setaria viridis]